MVAKKAKPKTTGEGGYANHIKGSRKEEVHKTFDTKGREAATKLGLKLGLKEITLRSWAYEWNRNAKPKTKARAKKKAA